MVSQCHICSNNIHRSNPGIVCAGHCRKDYHVNCIDISKEGKSLLLKSQDLSWICDSCKGASTSSASSIPSAAPSPIKTPQPTLSDIMDTLVELKSSIEFCSKKIDDFDEKLKSYSNKI